MQECVSFLDYDKISDDLIWFDKEIVLRFNVRLAFKGSDGKRKHQLKEYRYESNKYLDKNKVLTVRRHFDFYLTIDVKYEFDTSIMIQPKDMLNVRARLKMASRWFSDGVFGKDKKGKLHVIGSPNPIDITNLCGKYIRLEPTIITYDNGDQIEGVRIILNGERQVDISVEKFMEMFYLIGSMDMYNCAIGLVNYISPELGQNVCDINDDRNTENDYSDEENVKDATIKPYVNRATKVKKKSFFDSIDDL